MTPPSSSTTSTAPEQQTIVTWETSTRWRFQQDLTAGVAIGRRQTKPPSP
jgi:hypothetical protein